MKKLLMAVDIGSVSVKGILTDMGGNIISQYYLKINSDYITTYGRVINKLRSSINLDEYTISSFKLTGIRKRLLERSLGKEYFHNEINSLCNYVNTKYHTGTIIDIGNSLKIINYKNNIIDNYYIDDINIYGKFIDKVNNILGINNLYDIKIKNTRVKFNNTNTIIFDYNVINILLKKYTKEEILLGIYNLVIDNILYNLKNVSLKDNIIITGGLSLNRTFIKLLEQSIGKKLIVMDNSEYSSCIGLISSREKILIHK